MVGYQKHDTLTANQKFIAAVASGVITRGCTQPLDVIKVRTQLVKDSKNRKYSSLTVAMRIFREEGLRAFWAGHSLGQVYSITATASSFYFYELITMYIGQSDISKSSKRFATAMSGVIAGCASATLVIPLDVIRVRQMVINKQYKGFIKGARSVYRHGGFFAFYEGWLASMLQIGPAVGISFYVFRKLQQYLLQKIHSYDDVMRKRAPGNYSNNPQYLALASAIAGAGAGIVSKTVTYPFDLAKRRLQIGTHRYTSQSDTSSTSKRLIKCKQLGRCLHKAYLEDGFLGLYRGWNVTITKAQLTSVVTYTSYEILCYSFRELNVSKT